MTGKNQTIVICMGSSCFSRGNKKLVRMIQEFLKENHLEDEVTLKGAHCMAQCDKGPLMKVNDELVYNITEETLLDSLEQKLGIGSR
jgi:NADH:ubiquinone oxidoreductase subunit E